MASLLQLIKLSGREFYKVKTTLEKMAKFQDQFKAFLALDKTHTLPVLKSDQKACLNENTENTEFDAHYIYHPAWAARLVKKINPEKHIDISSTLHFCSILSAFIPTEFYDYRPAELNLDNLYSGKADLTHLQFATNSIESLSCMHTVEHIGLGRYGDPLDPEGDIKAINELKRVVKPGGSILFVTPVGRPRIMFNAHRIYDPSMIAEFFNGFELRQFSLVKDNQTFEYDASLKSGLEQQYGCGCFWFVKTN
jgi:SAM-dependent methyltransferase